MKTFIKIIFGLILTQSVSLSATCVGPDSRFCGDPIPKINGPKELCLNKELGCAPVFYSIIEWSSTSGSVFGPTPQTPWFAVAVSHVSGYPVIGVAGPCMSNWQCPAIYEQAYDDMRLRSLIAQRALRWSKDQ